MTSIFIVLPKVEDAKSIRNVLVKNGFNTTAVCATGSQVLSAIDELNDGIVICGYKIPDMLYLDLHECLPKGFEMLLMASQSAISECYYNDIVKLPMPIKVHELLGTVEMMSQAVMRRRRKAKLKAKERSQEETALIKEAKELLMNRNHMTEDEAYRYIQKCSMDSSTNMVETAQMVLAMMCS